MQKLLGFGAANIDLIVIYQWVESNPSNICIFPTDICFLLPHGTMLKALIQMLIQMFADVRWVGFLPPVIYSEKGL